MIFMPFSQFVAVWPIRKAHSVVTTSGNCIPSTLKEMTLIQITSILITKMQGGGGGGGLTTYLAPHS